MAKVKSITHLPPADFTPEVGNYKTLQPFRYWCQKVLPLVYDDSLSYYELLCKVVDYLNKTMEDVETLHGDVTNLHTAYEELQSYVNTYFSSLDVQEEINNKLDNMAESGELYEIIRRYTDPIVNEQNEKINVLKARMDTFSSLPDGSTSGDAELTDIRVGYNGHVYPSAGDAVREQVGGLKGEISELDDAYTDFKHQITTVKYSMNIFNKNDRFEVLTDTAMNSDGSIYTLADYNVIRIPLVDGATSYTLFRPNSLETAWICTPWRCAMYDDKFNNLGILLNNVQSVATPSNPLTKYLYINAGESIDKAMVVLDTVATAQYPAFVPYEEILTLKTPVLNWKDKKWLAYGDSITAICNGEGLNVGWAKYINEQYGFKYFYGRGVGGQTYLWNNDTFQVNSAGEYVNRGTSADNCKGCMCSWERISKMIPSAIKDEINMIFLMAGTNDMLEAENIDYNKPTWSASNTTDTDWVVATDYNGGDYDVNTFSGAIASTIMKLQTRCPNAIIILGTPLSMWDTKNHSNYEVSGKSMLDLSDTEIKVARYMNVPVIDVNGTCNINGYNYTRYITDGVHPYNDDGVKMLARTIIGGLTNVNPIMG